MVDVDDRDTIAIRWLCIVCEKSWYSWQCKITEEHQSFIARKIRYLVEREVTTTRQQQHSRQKRNHDELTRPCDISTKQQKRSRDIAVPRLIDWVVGTDQSAYIALFIAVHSTIDGCTARRHGRGIRHQFDPSRSPCTFCDRKQLFLGQNAQA